MIITRLTSGDRGQTQEQDEDRHPERGQPRYHLHSDWSKQPHTGFWLAERDHVTRLQSSDWLMESRAQSRPVISGDSEILEIELKNLTSEECMGMTSVLHMGRGAQRCHIIPPLQVKILSCCIAKWGRLLKVLQFNKITLKFNKVCLFYTLLEWELNLYAP